MRKLTFLFACLFIAGVSMVLAQTSISGKVISAEDGEAIVGASVMVKGTTTGTISNVNGDFTISLPGTNRALMVSFVGMKTVEVQAVPNMIIRLESDALMIDEVIVTAIGISREKRSLGYSVQSVKGDDLVKSGESNVINSLSSKFAGVQVISSGGIPGASSKIIIRGNSSFTGNNQPLIVVDGIPIDNSTNSTVAGDYPYNSNLEGVNNSNRALDINPDDIESVTVLKGPSASALYGAKAANGAIVYTTKRGRAGAPKVVYGLTAEFSQVNKLPERQFKYAQGSIIAGVPTFQNGLTPNSWGPLISSIPNAKAYDNAGEFFQTGTGYTHNLSITGGDDINSYRLSLSRFDQKGIIPNSDLKRTSARLNADSKITDKLTASTSVSYTNTAGTKVQNGSNLAGMMLTLLRSPSSWDLSDWKNEDGSSKSYFVAYDNPYWSAENNPFTDAVDRVIGATTFNYKFTPWLEASYKAGLDVYTEKTRQIFAIGSNNVDDLMGQVEEQTARYQQYYQDVLVSGQKTFIEKLEVGVKAGGNLTHIQSESLYGRSRQLTIPNFYNLSNGSDKYSDQKSSVIRTSALFFDADFAWDDYLFLGVTGRNEWSSTFGANKNNFFYPSVNLAIDFTRFIPDNDILSYGKLRMARATGGNSPEPYTSRTYYTAPYFADGFTDGNSFPFMGLSGYSYSNVLGNRDLRPEKTVENEIGADLRFLKGRISLDVTLYNKLTTDILVSRPIAGSSGAQAMVANSGKMSNKGLEIVLSASPVKTKNFSWFIDANFTRNVNEVLELADGVAEIDIESAFVDITSQAIVGKPYGALYATKWVRNDNGDLIIGNNGLPKVEAERGNIGNPFPDWTAGLRNTFTYKKFTASAQLDIRKGGMVWGGTVARMNRLGVTKESENREQTYVIPGVKESDGSANDIPISALNYFSHYKGDGALSATENAIFEGSWIRLREVSLSYRHNIKNNDFLQFVDLGVVGRNLWLKTEYPGVDPETSLTGAGSNLTGFDYFNNPSTKSVSISVKFGLF